MYCWAYIRLSCHWCSDQACLFHELGTELISTYSIRTIDRYDFIPDNQVDLGDVK